MKRHRIYQLRLDGLWRKDIAHEILPNQNQMVEHGHIASCPGSAFTGSSVPLSLETGLFGYFFPRVNVESQVVIGLV